MKMIKVYQYSVDALGVGYGLTYIQTVLGIIVLVLSIFNILLNAVIRIVKLIKKREIDKINEVLDDTIEELKEVGNNEKSK